MSVIFKVVEVDGQEVIIMEQMVTAPVEFRVYYDDTGKVLYYTCDNLEGNYLVVDKDTFSECRMDMKVVDGKLIRVTPGIIIQKYKQKEDGILTASEDISILVNKDFKNKQSWSMTYYELR